MIENDVNIYFHIYIFRMYKTKPRKGPIYRQTLLLTRALLFQGWHCVVQTNTFGLLSLHVYVAFRQIRRGGGGREG